MKLPYSPPEETEKHHRTPGKISVGDYGQVRMGPGLLAFLATPFPDESGERPGKHVHPMSGVPLGLCIHAAIVAAQGRGNGVDVLRGCECSFESPIPFDQPVIAHGEIVELGKRSVRARVWIETEKDKRLIMQGHLSLVRVVGERAADITDLHGTV